MEEGKNKYKKYSNSWKSKTNQFLFCFFSLSWLKKLQENRHVCLLPLTVLSVKFLFLWYQNNIQGKGNDQKFQKERYSLTNLCLCRCSICGLILQIYAYVKSISKIRLKKKESRPPSLLCVLLVTSKYIACEHVKNYIFLIAYVFIVLLLIIIWLVLLVSEKEIFLSVNMCVLGRFT